MLLRTFWWLVCASSATLGALRAKELGEGKDKTTIWSKLTRGMCTGVFPRVSLDNTTFTRLCSNCSQLNLSNIRCGTSSRLFYRICNDVDN
ncbi:hypothetical protein HZH66_011308 [Vespula vulgaris]|uniref:Secreted protein n=1 Tax=Vespula vulgaris TaxID=7454 RepID=A0A834JE95_VESVU|nr:hypothetical protein HZH66_011308 [Vespula vulgaris]